MTRIATWFPDEVSTFDVPALTFQQAKEVNPDFAWNMALWRPRGGLGDMLMLTPTFKTIKENFPNCKLTLITSFKYLDGALRELLWDNPYLDRVIDKSELDNNSDSQNKFHIIGNMDCPCREHEEPKRFPPNRVDLFVNSIGLKHKGVPKLFYKVKDEEKRWAADFLKKKRSEKRKPLIMYQPFASSEKRSPEVAQSKHILAAIAAEYPNCGILVPTHHSDWASDSDFNLLNCEHLKDYPVRRLGALIEVCDVIVAPDSSLLHLAIALDKPLVSIFGPTVPESRVNYHGRGVALNLGKHYCKGGHPCWFAKCNFGRICWKNLQESDVVKAIGMALRGEYHKFDTRLPDPPPSTRIRAEEL